jgi:hypothetical protein
MRIAKLPPLIPLPWPNSLHIFIQIAFCGRIVRAGAPCSIWICICTTVDGRILRVGAPRFIRIAFGARIIRVSFLDYAGLSLKAPKLLLNFRIRGACRRALR